MVSEDGRIKGVEAVIDKDLAGELLATLVGADHFIILTDVEGAMINYGKKNVKILRRVSVDEIERYYREGHFPPGSMGPKVMAAIKFIRNGGRKAAIGHLYKALDLLEEKTGTIITK